MFMNIIIIGLLISIIYIILHQKRHIAAPARLKKTNEASVILDSCALIDGRVLELVKCGFLPKRVVVPQFILKELQLLADGRDSYKRERARFGLQMVQQLQNQSGIVVEIEQTIPDRPTTDEQLVALAKQLSADLFTTDYNLNQVATIEGVTVLNVNELAHALRPVALPGESVHVTILQAGSNRDQGIGYLDDGTMVVVDGALKDIGKSIEVRVSKSHQTVAGKMLFAQKVATTSSTKSPLRPIKQRRNTTIQNVNNQKSAHPRQQKNRGSRYGHSNVK